MNKVVCTVSTLVVTILAGCMTSNESTLIRKGYRDISVGRPQIAERRAKKILRTDEKNPTALVLLAKARLAQNNPKGALDALETLDYTNPNDWACPDRIALHEGYLLKGTLTGNMEPMFRAKDIEQSVSKELSSKNFMTLVQYHENQNDPVKAADSFASFEEAKGQLLPEDVMHGFILYYSALRLDDAKRLWGQLTPRQKAVLNDRYKDIQF